MKRNYPPKTPAPAQMWPWWLGAFVLGCALIWGVIWAINTIIGAFL